jgi:hypothetical protein
MPRTITKTSAALSEAEATREALDAARATLALARELLADAETDQAAYQRRLHEGDLAVLDDARLAHAASRAADMATLVTGAERRVSRAKRNLVTDDPALADALAPIIRELLGAETVVSTSQAQYADGLSLPIARIVQRRCHSLDLTEGFLTGPVTVEYVRTRLHASLRADLAEAMTAEPGILLGGREPVIAVAARELADGIVIDEIVFDEVSTFPAEGLPVIVNGGGSWQNQRAAVSGPDVWSDPRQTKAKLIRDETDNGVRTREVEVEVIGLHNDWERFTNSVHATRQAIEAHMASRVGRCLAGLGRVTAVEILPSPQGQPPRFHHGADGAAVRARVTVQCAVVEDQS